jgi:hypothetical protein
MTITLVAAISVPSAAADPTLIRCPNNTHIWGENQADCDYDEGVTLGGGGAGGRCGGLCGIISHIPGLGGLGGLLG